MHMGLIPRFCAFSFYDGGGRERAILTRAYLRLIKHVNSIYKVHWLVSCACNSCMDKVSQIRIAYEWTEDFVIKYLWSAAGYGLIGVPLLLTRTHSIGVQTRQKDKESQPDDAVADRTECKSLIPDPTKAITTFA
jgi:ATP-binding cassette subfamily D (ALD) long-chain fatty acid import protein